MTNEREMKVASSLSISEAARTDDQDISVFRRKRKRWVLVLYVSFIGGFSFLLLALISSGFILFGLVEKTGDISFVGGLLTILAFSLLVFGAHSMDRIAEIERNEKLRLFEAEHKRILYSSAQWKTK